MKARIFLLTTLFSFLIGFGQKQQNLIEQGLKHNKESGAFQKQKITVFSSATTVRKGKDQYRSLQVNKQKIREIIRIL